MNGDPEGHLRQKAQAERRPGGLRQSPRAAVGDMRSVGVAVSMGTLANID